MKGQGKASCEDSCIERDLGTIRSETAYLEGPGYPEGDEGVVNLATSAATLLHQRDLHQRLRRASSLAVAAVLSRQRAEHDRKPAQNTGALRAHLQAAAKAEHWWQH